MATKNVTFQGSMTQLSGVLHVPAGGAETYAIFAHCFTCSKDLRAVRRVASALEEKNIGVLRFDFTGLGQSSGDFSETHLGTNIQDLIEAALFLEQNYHAPQLLIGHSLGGAAVLLAKDNIPSVKAVATIGAPAEASHVKKLFSPHLQAIDSDGKASVSIGGRPFLIKKEFVTALEDHPIKAKLNSLNAALLVCHSPRDTIVGIENASSIFAAAKHPKSFVSLDGADHLLSKSEDADYVAETIAAWSSRYIKKQNASKVTRPQGPEGVVATLGGAGYATDISMGAHSLRADEPASVGGADTGPAPYDLLLASLGACTAMTLRMYAKRKDITLSSVSVAMTHEKQKRDDKAVDVIHRELALEGDFDEKTKERMLQIADMCPVHKTLSASVDILSKLSD